MTNSHSRYSIVRTILARLALGDGHARKQFKTFLHDQHLFDALVHCSEMPDIAPDGDQNNQTGNVRRQGRGNLSVHAMQSRNIEICGMKRSNLMTRMARSFTSTLFRIDRLVVGLALFLVAAMRAAAQQLPAKPPAVGVVDATRKPVTQSSEYVGRIQAIERVNLTARVAAFLDQRFFAEGTEVKKDDQLYRLEQGPFLADVKAKEATIAQLKAQLKNAQIVLGRAKALLNGPAGQQSTVDTATANSEALEAQVQAAEAQLQQSQINLDYTEIRAPIDGKIGRTAVTAGNYVSPSSGILATIVSQDPMHVAFAVSSQKAISLSRRAAETPVVVKIRLGEDTSTTKSAH